MKRIQKSIHVITTHFYPVLTGVEVNIAETYSLFVNLGWNVVVHTSKDTHTEKNVLPDIGEYKGLVIKRYQRKWWGFIPRIDSDFRGIVALHFFSIIPHFYVYILVAKQKLFHKKDMTLVLVPHGGYTPDWSLINPIKSFIKAILHRSVGLLWINYLVDGIRAVSNWEKQELIKAGVRPEIIRTIENGIQGEALLEMGKKASTKIKRFVKIIDPYIVQIGRIDKQKNFETAIRALPLLPKELKFLIIGPDHVTKYRESIIRLVNQLGLERRVIFAGTVHGIDKYYLIRHAKAMVHMARWESFCNAVLEGMSQGLVCIVANNTALKDLISHRKTGFIINTYDYRNLAKKINLLFNRGRSSGVMKIKQAARKSALSRTWKQTAIEMEKYYVSLLSRVA